MVEIKKHKAYELLNNKYDRVFLDYVILSTDKDDEGVEAHKKAIIEAFNILNKRFENIDYKIHIDISKMSATKINIDELLTLPPDNFYNENKKSDRTFNIPTPLPYWFAFLEPPYGTKYLVSDFIEFNDILFPNKEDIEVYRWNDNFSNYFDAGKEWWGTGLWTALDVKNKVLVVIGASLTD